MAVLHAHSSAEEKTLVEARSDRLRTILIWTTLLTILFAWQAAQRTSLLQVVLSTTIWVVLIFLFLAAGWSTGIETLRQWIEKVPARVYALPLALLVLFAGYTGITGKLTIPSLMLGMAFLLLPVEMAWRERQLWKDSDLFLGWGVLLVPLLLAPLDRDLSVPANVLLRVGAFLLPGLFVWLARGKWKGVRFLLGVMYIWFSVEFGAIPRTGFPVVGLFKLYAIVMVLYMALISNQLTRLGFGLSLNKKEFVEALRQFIYFLPLGLVIGLFTGFLHPRLALPSIGDAVVTAIAIYFFTGLPEEILFRGIIYRFIAEYVPNTSRALALSSVIFGAAHLNNPPMVAVYFVLASIAGWFYGQAYIRTGRIAPAALVHTAVDWTWSMFL